MSSVIIKIIFLIIFFILGLSTGKILCDRKYKNYDGIITLYNDGKYFIKFYDSERIKEKDEVIIKVTKRFY